MSFCCGYPLPQLFSSDLKTLRQICTSIESHKIPDRSLTISLITERYPDLEGSIAQIPICHLKQYDKVSMGQTEYGFEWLVHPNFSSTVLQCKQYDLILLTTTIAAKEVEGQIF